MIGSAGVLAFGGSEITGGGSLTGETSVGVSLIETGAGSGSRSFTDSKSLLCCGLVNAAISNRLGSDFTSSTLPGVFATGTGATGFAGVFTTGFAGASTIGFAGTLTTGFAWASTGFAGVSTTGFAGASTTGFAGNFIVSFADGKGSAGFGGGGVAGTKEVCAPGRTMPEIASFTGVIPLTPVLTGWAPGPPATGTNRLDPSGFAPEAGTKELIASFRGTCATPIDTPQRTKNEHNLRICGDYATSRDPNEDLFRQDCIGARL